jgi:hypothetical protein
MELVYQFIQAFSVARVAESDFITRLHKQASSGCSDLSRTNDANFHMRVLFLSKVVAFLIHPLQRDGTDPAYGRLTIDYRRFGDLLSLP